LEVAAGLAGLLKVVLSLQHEQIPAQPAFGELNPYIPWSELKVAVARERREWPRGGRARRAGVSAFGLSGTNAHAILEEAPATAPPAAAPERAAELCVLSARSPEALEAAAGRLGEHLRAHPELSLGDLAFSLSTTRSPMEHRLAVAASSREALLSALDAAARGQTPPGAARGHTSAGDAPKVVFVFPGQGSQWLGMGRRLLAEEPVFRAALQACDRILQAEADFSLLDALDADEATSPLGRIEVIQPALFAIEVALVALWRSWGVEPDVVVGHSMGEVAAAHVAGALSLEDAVALICRRSRLLRRIAGRGAMAVVELSHSDAEAAVRGYEDRLQVAVSNSPRSTVLAGDPAGLAEVISTLEARGVFCRQVKVDVASHSPQVDPLRPDLLAALAELRPQAATVPMRSTVTGAAVEGPELGAEYWAENLRKPVRFAAVVQALLESGHGLFLEMSPHPILTTAVEEVRQAAGREGAALSSLRREQGGRETLLRTLGELYVRGYPVAFSRLFFAGSRRVPLPTYPWQRQRCWIEAPSGSPHLWRGADAEGHLAANGDRQASGPISLADCFYSVEWHEEDRSEPRSPGVAPASPGQWLLCADQTGIADALGAKLAELGEACTWVFRGSSYQQLSREKFQVNPTALEDFERLLAEVLGAGGSPLRGVIHLWSLEAPEGEASEAALDAAVAEGCGSVLYLLQALSRKRLSSPPRLWLTTRGAAPIAGANGSSMSFLQAPLLGFGKVAAQEHPDMWGGLIDLDPAPRLADAALLCAELFCTDGEDQVAFRAGRRYVARLERCRAPQSPPVRFSAAGAYLITGGLGGIGLRAAHWMVERGARYLVLLGRRGASEQAQATVRALERAGARVQLVQADVSDMEAMARVFEELASAAPPLRGILHAAGVASEKSIEELDHDGLSSGLRAKVTGTWVLHQSTRNMALDFFVGFSSAAAIWGGRGLATYAAANEFLDALVHHRRRLGLSGSTVNWGLWEGAGLGTQEYRQRLARTGLGALRAEEAFEALSRLLSAGVVQVAVAKVDVQVFKELQEAKRRRPFLERMVVHSAQAAPERTNSSLARQWRALPPLERRGAVASYLQAQAAKVLGLPASQLDPRRALNHLGMDSLTALELRNSLQAVGITAGLRVILEGASVLSLTDIILPQLDEHERLASEVDTSAEGQRPKDGAREEESLSSQEQEARSAGPPASGPRIQPDAWVFVRRPNEQAAVRLLCFPYAGGGPPVFARWPEGLPASVELGVVHLPGRGSRLGERPFAHMDQLVEAMTPALVSYLGGKPFAFFGHCLGALIMFETLHRLRREHGVEPVRLFISGARAPRVYTPEQIRKDFMQYSPVPGVPGHALPDPHFLDLLRDLGFDSSRALYEDEEMRRLILPAVRADFEINNTYTYDPKPPLDIPITAVGGRVDPFVNAEQILGWRHQTTGEFSVVFRPGGHYFIEQERPFWLQVLTRELSPIANGPDAGAGEG
jgi:acyl transferase domain-containing protein/surfactin synthase thioesterase subunit